MRSVVIHSKIAKLLCNLRNNSSFYSGKDSQSFINLPSIFPNLLALGLTKFLLADYKAADKWFSALSMDDGNILIGKKRHAKDKKRWPLASFLIVP